jgi:hypothetical protein
VSKADDIIERSADKLEHKAEELAHEDGLKVKLAHELADDAAFLRKLKPSKIAARARGGRPKEKLATRLPEPGQKPAAGSGPNPLVLAAVAFAVGILVAKAIDWRSHAHPRG